MLFTCCFEALNLPIFHSRPVCYLYVLPVCYLHYASKLRTTQSFIPGQYAIYRCCQYAIYMLFRSFEPPNLSFLASMLSIRIASMLFTCCFEASNQPIFHSRPVCYLYVLPVCYLHAASKRRTSQSYIPVSMLSIRIASMPFRCCFEASNLPILHSGRVCYLYVLPVCHLHAASKLRTSQSSIPGHYAIYTYCQYAIYMLLRSFEPPNLPFMASMLSIRIASMPFTCASKLRTSQSSIPGLYAIYTYCQYAIYMLLRTSQSSIPGHYAIYTYCQYAI